jgi:hypothetical protein
MAEQLEQKVDKLVTDAEAKTVAADVLAPPTPTEPTPMQSDPLAPEIEPIEQDPKVEEALVSGYEQAQDIDSVEIAGPFKSAAEWLAKRTAKAEQKVVPPLPDQPIQEIGGKFILRQMPEEEVDAINKAMGGEYIKGLNMPDIFEKMGEAEMGEWLAKFKDANQDLFEQARRGTLNIDAIVGLANEMGADTIVERLLKRKIGDPLAAEEAIGGLFALRASYNKTNELMVAAQALPDGVERQAANARFFQMMTFTGRLATELSGGTSEAARTTAMVGAIKRQIEIPNVDVIAQGVDRIITEAGPEQIEHATVLYGALQTAAQRAKYTQQIATLGSKAMDVVTEIWINSILSSPITHAVNIAGNLSYGSLRLVETFVAGVVGEVRGAITGTKDRVRIREGFAQLQGIKNGVIESAFVAGKTLVKGEPSDGVSKIDTRTRRAIGTTDDPKEVYEMIKEGNVVSAAVNTFGITMRLGGRALLAEDEFFKGIGYRMSLHQQAEMVAGETYDYAREAGKGHIEAQLLAAQARANTLNKPPDDIVIEAQREAQVATFQQDLDGFLGDLQGAMSHPLAKIIVPFYKTPTNVMKAVAQRTPLGLMVKVKSGRDFDKMVARVGIGSATMMTFASLASGSEDADNDMIIMGSGPPDAASRQALARKGIQPYSINIKNYTEGGIWDGTYTSISYSRFDPVSGILAMGADFAYYANYEEDTNALEALAMGAAIGVQEYMLQLPVLQGVQELTSILMMPSPIDRQKKLQEFLGQKATSTVLGALPTVSSFMAGRERINDPTIGSTMLPETGLFGEDPTELPAFSRGFYTELQRAKARSPFFSDAVEPKLNLWGEKITAGTGEEWEFWSPVRIQETKFSPLDDEILSFGAGIKMPAQKQTPPKGLKTETSPTSILLNARQYNDMIRMMNEMDTYGNLPNDPDYRSGETLADNLMELISNPSYQKLDRERKRLQFNAIITAKRLAAKDRLFFEDDNLRKKSSGVQ